MAMKPTGTREVKALSKLSEKEVIRSSNILKENMPTVMLIAQVKEVKEEERLEQYCSRYDPIVLKALKSKRIQLLGSLRMVCEASVKQLPPYKGEKGDQVLQGPADGNYPVSSPPEEDSEQPDAGAVTQPKVHGKNGKRKLADYPTENGNKEPTPSENEIMEEEDEIFLVEAARKPHKQQKRGSEDETALLALQKEIKEEQEKAERNLMRLEDSLASRDAIDTLVKKAGEA